MANPKYYHIDTGFFPQIVKLAFSDQALQQIFEDNNLGINIHAFERGEAETHTITTPYGSLIIMAFDLANYEEEPNDAVWVGVITHEVSHAVEKLGEFVGEEFLAGETRAYLTQSVAEQVYAASVIERVEYARKANRSKAKQKSKGGRGPKPKMDKHNSGRSRQADLPQEQSAPSGVENDQRESVAKATDSISTARRSGSSSACSTKL